MPSVNIEGIKTRYEVTGAGPPLLMYAPAGFDATLDKWATQGVYAKTRLIDHLRTKYTCITFDRRECGLSGGRVERVTWAHYVAQGKGLLDHLEIERAHIMGGCMGCCPVAAFGVMHPEATLSMILFWPVGGAKYRLSSHQRFAEHLAFVHQNGLEAVVALVARDGKPFGTDPARRPLGLGPQARPRVCDSLRQAERRCLQADRRRHRPHLVRPRHCAGRRARGPDAPRHPGPGGAGERCRARHLRGAVSGGMPAAARNIGTRR